MWRCVGRSQRNTVTIIALPRDSMFADDVYAYICVLCLFSHYMSQSKILSLLSFVKMLQRWTLLFHVSNRLYRTLTRLLITRCGTKVIHHQFTSDQSPIHHLTRFFQPYKLRRLYPNRELQSRTLPYGTHRSSQFFLMGIIVRHLNLRNRFCPGISVGKGSPRSYALLVNKRFSMRMPQTLYS